MWGSLCHGIWVVLTFTDWHKALVVKGKVREIPSRQQDLKDQLSYFFSPLLPNSKRTLCKEVGGEAEFHFLGLVDLCSDSSHFYLKLSHPQICAADTQFTTHFLCEGFLKLFFSWLLKKILEVPNAWHQALGFPVSPLRADFGVCGRLLILSPLVASSKQCCFIRLLRLLSMKLWLCSLLSA